MRLLHRELPSAVLMYFAIAELSEVSEHCYFNKLFDKRTTTIHLIPFLEYYTQMEIGYIWLEMINVQ